METKTLIKKVLKEEISSLLRRRLNFGKIDSILKKIKIAAFRKNEPIENSITATIERALYDLMPEGFDDDNEEYYKVWDEIKQYLMDNYSDELKEYFEKRKKDAEEENTNSKGEAYIFVKHDKPYGNRDWRGFAEGFKSFDDMITKYGNWVDVDWDEVKKKLDSINEYPESTYSNTMNSRPLRIKSIGDEGNRMGYNFSIIKSIPKDRIQESFDIKQDEPILNDSGEMYYIDWDENYGKSFKIVHTPEGAQNGVKWDPNMVSVITPENGKAWNMWVELSPKKLLKWKDSWSDIQKSLGVYKYNQIVRNMSNNQQEIKEGLHDTSWENDEGDRITLIDLLNATEDIPVKRIPVEKLKPHLLTWDGDEDEIKKIDKSDLQYPILIFVDNDGKFISIIDGHHRAQKAVRKGLETIKAKIIPINSLPKDIRKVFGHLGKEEQNESELTERCWAGYTQKGMKTMFGKRYPNCVKKKK
jgi:hypothetical protein